MKFEFDISGKVSSVTLEKAEEGFCAKVGDDAYKIKCRKMERGVFLLDVNGESFKVFLGENGGRYCVIVGEEEYTIKKAASGISQAASVTGEEKQGNIVIAPMPGKVIKILCTEGDHVSVGQTLAIIEAMKMENNIDSHKDAVIGKIVVKAGDQVNLSDPIMEFESESNNK